MKKQRPVHLDLQKISFPASAIASILHRVSGVINFFALGIFIWILHLSLMSSASFMEVQSIFQLPLVKFVIWGSLSALLYHLLAGIRHLIMDKGYWEEIDSGRQSAKIVFILAIVSSIGVGCWIW